MVRELRRQILERLGAYCVGCGYRDIRALQIDHVYSDGAEERKAMSGATYYRHILRNLDSGRYRILCANCNACKKFDYLEDRRQFKLEEHEHEIMTNEYEMEADNEV